MSTDKRKVSTDALETLGTIIDETAGRDAIHLAVEPVIAGEKLYPGDDIGIVNGRALRSGKKIGIVDPFIKGPIHEGQMFWLVVYPRQITSLRHVWSHPDFEEEGSKPTTSILTSVTWIKEYAESLSLDYEELMTAADEFLRDGSRLRGGSNLEGECVSDYFWDHYQVVRGLKVYDKDNFFSCSC